MNEYPFIEHVVARVSNNSFCLADMNCTKYEKPKWNTLSIYDLKKTSTSLVSKDSIELISQTHQLNTTVCVYRTHEPAKSSY